MKILAISDTHGDISNLIYLEHIINNVDMIIHCGDNQKDGKLIEKKYGKEVIYVTGNCDVVLRNISHKIVKTPYGAMYVCHGHEEGVNYDLQRLYYKALENNCKVAIFGHTHKGLFYKNEDVLFVNPGSLTKPRDASCGSAALIDCNEKEFFCTIIDLKNFINKDKVEGGEKGKLRDVLNNSDRF